MSDVKEIEDGENDANPPTDTNVMRQEYRMLDEKDKNSILHIKDMGKAFYEVCDNLGPSREMSVAKTKIEEAVMWAVKGLTR